jgi:hypothetical protein
MSFLLDSRLELDRELGHGISVEGDMLVIRRIPKRAEMEATLGI